MPQEADIIIILVSPSPDKSTVKLAVVSFERTTLKFQLVVEIFSGIGILRLPGSGLISNDVISFTASSPEHIRHPQKFSY